MRILVDADACPVKGEIIKVARELKLKVIMFIDTAHIINDDYSEVITVDQGKDSVDLALINSLIQNDIVVTQDYGVASLVIGKKCFAINQNGRIYDENNIDMLMFERHISQKQRKMNKRTSRIKKRTSNDNQIFEESLRNLIIKL